MKRHFVTFLLLASAAWLAACSASRATTEAPPANPVDEIVANSIEARGGLEAIRAIESVSMSGTFETEGMGMPMTIRTKRPGMVRTDVVVEAMGMEFISGYDGEVAWELNPMLGSRPRRLEGERVRAMVAQADLDGELVDYRQKGLSLELIGKTQLDSTDVYEIRMTAVEDSTIRTLYVDAQTYLTVRIDGEGVNPQTGRSTTVQTLMSDYQEAGGVLFPHAIDIRMRGASPQKVRLETIEVNVALPDSIFAFPGT